MLRRRRERAAAVAAAVAAAAFTTPWASAAVAAAKPAASIASAAVAAARPTSLAAALTAADPAANTFSGQLFTHVCRAGLGIRREPRRLRQLVCGHGRLPAQRDVVAGARQVHPIWITAVYAAGAADQQEQRLRAR